MESVDPVDLTNPIIDGIERIMSEISELRDMVRKSIVHPLCNIPRNIPRNIPIADHISWMEFKYPNKTVKYAVRGFMDRYINSEHLIIIKGQYTDSQNQLVYVQTTEYLLNEFRLFYYGTNSGYAERVEKCSRNAGIENYYPPDIKTNEDLMDLFEKGNIGERKTDIIRYIAIRTFWQYREEGIYNFESKNHDFTTWNN